MEAESLPETNSSGQMEPSFEGTNMFTSPPRSSNGPVLADDSMTPSARLPHTPLSSSRVTVATPGTIVQRTLVELDDLIHLRKMELSNLRAQNKSKSENGPSPRPRATYAPRSLEGARYLSRGRTFNSTSNNSLPTTAEESPCSPDTNPHAYDTNSERHESPRVASRTGSPLKSSSPLKTSSPLRASTSSAAEAETEGNSYNNSYNNSYSNSSDSDHVTVSKVALDEFLNAQAQLSSLHEAELKELLETQTALDNMKLEQVALRAKVAHLETVTTEKSSEVDLLNGQLRTLSQEKNKLTTQFHLLQDEFESLKLELASQTDQLKNAKNTISALEAAAATSANSEQTSTATTTVDIQIDSSTVDATLPITISVLDQYLIQYQSYVDLADLLSIDISDINVEVDNTEEAIAEQVRLLQERFYQSYASRDDREVESAETYEQIAMLQAQLEEAETRFSAAAQSAFEWEAHSSRNTDYYNELLAAKAAEIQTLNDELAKRAAAPFPFDQPTDASEVALVPVNNSASYVTNNINPDMEAELAEAKATIEYLQHERRRVAAIAKTWWTACDKSWEHCELRRFFDALQMNYKFEATKKLYKLKCKEFLTQERIRVQHELRNNYVADPNEENSIIAALNSVGSDSAASSKVCCRACGRAFEDGASLSKAVTPVGSPAHQQAAVVASAATVATGATTAADIEMMGETLRSWAELFALNRKRSYGDNSSFLLLLAFFQMVLWLLLLIGVREYVKSIPGFMEALAMQFGQHRLTS